MAINEVRCPTCRQPAPWHGNPHRPFCSERCRLLDLSNWASERYRIANGPIDAQAEEDGDREGDAS